MKSGETPQPPLLYEVRRRWLALDASESPEVRFLLALWNSRRREGRLPSRSDFDPADFKQLLPDILLIDVLRDPLDFRYRLAGTRTFEIHKIELTGKSIRELVPEDFVANLWSDLCGLIETKEPQYVALEFINAAGLSRAYRVLRLPLSSDGTTVDMVLIYADFGSERELFEKIFGSIRKQASG